MKLIGLSTLASVLLVALYLAAGGADYSPAKVQDPCEAREWRDPSSLDELGQQLALSGIDGAACKLGVSRESLARALASDQTRQQYAADHDISEEEFDAGVRAGLERMISDAEEAGAINGLVAVGLRALARVVPASEALDLLQDARPLIECGLGAADGVSGLGDSLEQGADRLNKGLKDGTGGLRDGMGGFGDAVEGIQGAVEGLLDSLSEPQAGRR